MSEAVEIPVRVYRSQRAQASEPDGPTAEQVEAMSVATGSQPEPEQAAGCGPQPAEESAPLAGANSRLDDETNQLKNALRELKKDFQRARDHHQQEQLAARRQGEELAARALLPVIEALLRAQEQYRSAPGGLATGLGLLQSKVEAALAAAGFAMLGQVGEPFDPNRHEAVTAVGAGANETVAQLLVPGLARGEQVVVPARVVVGRSGA